MGIQLIIYLVIGLGVTIVVAFQFMMDDAFDSLGTWAFTKLGWLSGHGPILIEAERNDDKLTLILLNQGKTRIRLAAVEGRDFNNQRHFPKPRIAEDEQDGIQTEEQALRRFSKIVLDPQGSQTVSLNTTDLLALRCLSLAIVDSNGKSWPVRQFNGNELIRES